MKLKIRSSPISPSRLMPARSKPDRFRAPIAPPNTINCCASKKTCAAPHAFPAAKLSSSVTKKVQTQKHKVTNSLIRAFVPLWLKIMTKKRGPMALIIIDGWGYSAAREGNAIALADNTFLRRTLRKVSAAHCSKRTARVSVCPRA